MTTNNQKPNQKDITKPNGDLITRLWLNTLGPETCQCCGKTINNNDYIGCCIECGEIFCEACAASSLEHHRLHECPGYTPEDPDEALAIAEEKAKDRAKSR